MKRTREVTLGGLGISPSSVKIVKNILKLTLQFAVDNRFIAENPVSNIKIPLRYESSATSLTVEEARAFASVREQFWFGNAFVFQLHTGLRNQELMALIWDDVDFKNGTLRIERACKWVKGTCVEIGHTKTRRSNRVIELDARQLELLQFQRKKQQEVIQQCKEPDAKFSDDQINDWLRKERPRIAHLYTNTSLIFSKRDGGVPSATHARREFKRMLQAAGVGNGERNIRWYDLRHTHASILLTEGVPIHEVAERLGHTISMLLNTYTHVLSNRRRIASKVIADLILI